MVHLVSNSSCRKGGLYGEITTIWYAAARCILWRCRMYMCCIYGNMLHDIAVELCGILCIIRCQDGALTLFFIANSVEGR